MLIVCKVSKNIDFVENEVLPLIHETLHFNYIGDHSNVFMLRPNIPVVQINPQFYNCIPTE